MMLQILTRVLLSICYTDIVLTARTAHFGLVLKHKSKNQD